MSVNVSSTACIDTEPLEKILTSIPNADPNDLIPILQEVQKAYGYLPKPILMEVSERTGIPASRIYGVATFYEQFYLEPRGRHTVKCCRGTACHVRGGPDIIKAIEQALGIEQNQTTDDMRYTFETVACLGTCFLAPVIMVNNDYYGHLSSGKIKSILEKYA
ncbi:MAG: NADH-quinone oxidoreductase subunit NuoE [Planctomycetota bacterium]|jgi:NADH-quinone oxidoreductase subunit E